MRLFTIAILSVSWKVLGLLRKFLGIQNKKIAIFRYQENSVKERIVFSTHGDKATEYPHAK